MVVKLDSAVTDGHLGKFDGSEPRTQIFKPSPEGEISMYVSPNRSTIPCAHGLTFPSESRQSSRSIPVSPYCGKNAKARPEYFAVRNAARARSMSVQSAGFVLDARRPSTRYGTWIFHPPDGPAVEFGKAIWNGQLEWFGALVHEKIPAASGSISATPLTSSMSLYVV